MRIHMHEEIRTVYIRVYKGGSQCTSDWFTRYPHHVMPAKFNFQVAGSDTRKHLARRPGTGCSRRC